MPLSLKEIPPQPFLGVVAFPPKVGFQFEHGAAEQGVDPTVNLGCRLLEIDVIAVGTEPVDEKAVQMNADFLVTGTASEFLS